MGSVIPLVVVAMVPIIVGTSVERGAVGKRSTGASDGLDYPDYPAKYEDFPVVPKRAALLFDQLMVALQKVVDNQGRGEIGSRGLGRPSAPHLPAPSSQVVPSADEQTMDLQRRGQAKGRVYWRCYFNAVTCFKRK